MNKSLVFKRAWNEHKVKMRHNCQSTFGSCLSRQFNVARMLGSAYK